MKRVHRQSPVSSGRTNRQPVPPSCLRCNLRATCSGECSGSGILILMQICSPRKTRTSPQRALQACQPLLLSVGQDMRLPGIHLRKHCRPWGRLVQCRGWNGLRDIYPSASAKRSFPCERDGHQSRRRCLVVLARPAMPLIQKKAGLHRDDNFLGYIGTPMHPRRPEKIIQNIRINIFVNPFKNSF